MGIHSDFRRLTEIENGHSENQPIGLAGKTLELSRFQNRQLIVFRPVLAQSFPDLRTASTVFKIIQMVPLFLVLLRVTHILSNPKETTYLYILEE